MSDNYVYKCFADSLATIDNLKADNTRLHRALEKAANELYKVLDDEFCLGMLIEEGIARGGYKSREEWVARTIAEWKAKAKDQNDVPSD